jgi:hypothetical protein
MHYLNTILILATAVSAIDIHGHNEEHCNGEVMTTWSNVQADRCVSGGQLTYTAFSFSSIPTNWAIITRSYKSNTCAGGELANQFHSNGRDWVCHGADRYYGIRYKGAGYSFNNVKRTGADGAVEQECQKPDLLTLKDGRKYNIAGVQDEVVHEMVGQTSRQVVCNVLTVVQ